MSIALLLCGCILPLMMVSAIALLVCRGVCGCLCTNSSSVILMYNASCAMMYSPASSTLVADDMTILMMRTVLSTTPLFGCTVVLLERMKCLSALLRDLGLLK